MLVCGAAINVKNHWSSHHVLKGNAIVRISPSKRRKGISQNRSLKGSDKHIPSKGLLNQGLVNEEGVSTKEL